jgi:hypothetical protein
VSSVKINNILPPLDNATYTNSDNVTVEIVAQDIQSGVRFWHLASDNTTPTTSSAWTAFSTAGPNVSENVTWDLTNADGIKEVYAWVRNAQDNISVITTKVMAGYDNITLDATAPSTDNATPKLTGTLYSLDLVTDNLSATQYVDNLTVALDNLTSWKTETLSSTSSGILTGQYYVTDNETFKPVYTTAGWRVLDDNLSLTFGADWNGTGTLGNNSIGLKTLYVWAKDNASNVSGNYTSVSITFDNESPVFRQFFLRDTDNGTQAPNFLLTPTHNDYLFTNSDNVSIPLDNLSIVPDNGTGLYPGAGIIGYYFADNTSTRGNRPGPDNVTWSTDNSTLFVIFDNATNQLKTITGYLKDAAGKISAGVNRTIGFDNYTPVISRLGWMNSHNTGASDGRFEFPTTNTKTGNLTIGLQGHDNNTTGADNYSSKITHFFVASELKRAGTTLGTPLEATDDNVSSATWIPFTSLKNADDNSSIAFDNITFDNASYEFEFTSGLYNMASGDNLTVVVWLRDNASNISGNKTTEFDLDNNTLRSVY